jgi:Flp pilus assembly protein CpaB
MSRRGRALAFVLAAGFAAAAAAAVADRYGARVARGYGELRPVVVAARELRPGEAIGPRQLAALELRRIPSRFVPPGALRSPSAAIGLVTAAPIEPGSYLLASQLHPPRPAGGAALGLSRSRRPVQIAVSGAEALFAAGAPPAGSRVDVVVTSEPTGAGPGRVYVAAAGVPLISLGSGDSSLDGTAVATLGLTRREALRLIAAESFARQVTLLPRR